MDSWDANAADVEGRMSGGVELESVERQQGLAVGSQ
jgi:hypothetical protein